MRWYRRQGRRRRRNLVAEDKNCCVYTQQLKWLHKHDPLSFSLFLFTFFPLPHHLAGSAKANQIEVVSSALAGLTDWKKPDLLQPSGHECHSALYGRQFPLQSIPTAILQNWSWGTISSRLRMFVVRQNLILPSGFVECSGVLGCDSISLVWCRLNFQIGRIFHLRWKKYSHSKQ